MITQADEPVYELRQRMIHWSYSVKLADITDRLQELVESEAKPLQEPALRFILEQLRALQA